MESVRKMIKNIIFDIGNVLTDFCWQDFLKGKGFDDKMVERIGKASTMGPYWCEYDRGVWSQEQILEAFIATDPEIEKELRQAYDSMEGMVIPREYAIPLVQHIKSLGYGVYYLSNYPEKACNECTGALDFIPYTDGGILSFRDKVVKPGPEIYHLLMDRYQLKAEECVFLDDTQKNVEGAKAVGMHALLFRDLEQAKRELRDLGVDL